MSGSGARKPLARRYALAHADPAVVAAGVQPMGSVYPNFRGEARFRAECEAARRDGHRSKMAIHLAQVPAIDEVFTMLARGNRAGERVVSAVAAQPDAGVIPIDGEMLKQAASSAGTDAAEACGNGHLKAQDARNAIYYNIVINRKLDIVDM